MARCLRIRLRCLRYKNHIIKWSARAPPLMWRWLYITRAQPSLVVLVYLSGVRLSELSICAHTRFTGLLYIIQWNMRVCWAHWCGRKCAAPRSDKSRCRLPHTRGVLLVNHPFFGSLHLLRLYSACVSVPTHFPPTFHPLSISHGRGRLSGTSGMCNIVYTIYI